MIDAFHNLHQRSRTLDEKRSVSHESAVGRLPTLVQVFDKNEHILADDAVHLLGFHILEDVPAKVVVWHIPVGFGVMPIAFLENGVFHLDTHHVGIGFLGALRIIKHLHEKEVGHLLQNGHGIGDASSPKRVPYRINAVLDFAGYHSNILIIVKQSTKIQIIFHSSQVVFSFAKM